MIANLGYTPEAAAHGLRTVGSDRIVGAVDAADAADAAAAAAVNVVFVLALDTFHSSDHIALLAVQAGRLLGEHCRCNLRSLIVVHLMNSHSCYLVLRVSDDRQGSQTPFPSILLVDDCSWLSLQDLQELLCC